MRPGAEYLAGLCNRVLAVPVKGSNTYSAWHFESAWSKVSTCCWKNDTSVLFVFKKQLNRYKERLSLWAEHKLFCIMSAAPVLCPHWAQKTTRWGFGKYHFWLSSTIITMHPTRNVLTSGLKQPLYVTTRTPGLGSNTEIQCSRVFRIAQKNNIPACTLIQGTVTCISPVNTLPSSVVAVPPHRL